MSSDSPSPAPGSDSAEIRDTFELILALERAEDPETATFALKQLESHLQHSMPSPHTLIQVARYARDAGDVSPWTLTLLTDYLAELMPRPDDPGTTKSAESTESTESGHTPSDELDDEALSRQDAEYLAANLESLGAPDLAKLRLTDEEAYFVKVDDARLRALNLEDRSSYDDSLHMLPLAAAAIARVLIAHSASVAPEDAPLIGLAHRIVVLAAPNANSFPQFERKSVMTLVCDGWRYASLWDAEQRARAVLEHYPNVVEDDFGKVVSLKTWMEMESPSLLDIGIVCLGLTSMLPPHRIPAPAPLLTRGTARPIRSVVSDWLRQHGYVRAHDVLLAALAEPEPPASPGV